MSLVIRRNHLSACLAAAVSMALATGAGATSIQLTPVKDNTLIQVSPFNTSNGAGDGIYVGRTSTAGVRRGVLAFDLSAIPVGATINSATLTLHMSKTAAPLETDEVHRLTADWGEAGSAGSGSGAPAQTGDATWTARFFGTQTWATPGGNFVAAASASTNVGGVGDYSWTGAGIVADVQFWLDTPKQNVGWILIGPEGVAKTTKKFDSREGLNPPKLDIVYNAPAGVDPGSGVTQVEFKAPWPVPAHSAVNLGFALPRPAHVMLAIHDVAGRLVRHLVTGVDESAGPHTIVWDGRVDSGDRAAAGIYVARLVVDGVAYERRLPLLR